MEDNYRPFHDLPVTNEKKYIGPDNELIELMWRNGHVVFHNQTNCRALPAIFESKQTQKPESLLKCGDLIVNSSDFIDEDVTATWFQNPLDNSIEKEFSEFFYGMPTAEPIPTDKAMKEDSNACAKRSSLHPQENVMLPPKSSLDDSAAVAKFSNHRKPGRADLVSENRNFCEEASSSETVVGMGDSSSMKTILSSVCGSNQAQNQVEVSHVLSNVRGAAKDSLPRSTLDRLQVNIYDPAIAYSPSGGSRQNKTNHGHKRKGRDAEEYEGHSEEAEYVSAEANKQAPRHASGRRSRAAEVHNLSERKRRDKINEKMRALQELIPHCNKSDKASMLDEAIEYLKSLQLQLQIMWMGSGMAPMLFPSIHQYMSCMGIGMNHHSVTSIGNPGQLPRAPSDQSMPGTSLPNQPPVCPLQAPSSINFATQMHNFHLPEQYSSNLGFPQMQVTPQVMNMYTYGPQMMQKNHMVATVDKQQHSNNMSSI